MRYASVQLDICQLSGVGFVLIVCYCFRDQALNCASPSDRPDGVALRPPLCSSAGQSHELADLRPNLPVEDFRSVGPFDRPSGAVPSAFHGGQPASEGYGDADRSRDHRSADDAQWDGDAPKLPLLAILGGASAVAVVCVHR